MSIPLMQLLDAGNLKPWADRIVAAIKELQGLQGGGEGGAAVRVQRGVITLGTSDTTKTATVLAVDVNTAELRFLGQNDINNPIYIELTNSTTITGTRVSSGATSRSVSWELTG